MNGDVNGWLFFGYMLLWLYMIYMLPTHLLLGTWTRNNHWMMCWFIINRLKLVTQVTEKSSGAPPEQQEIAGRWFRNPNKSPMSLPTEMTTWKTQLLVFFLQFPATESETGYHPATETRGVDIHSNFQESPSRKRHKTSQHWLRKKCEWRCLNDPMITQLVLRENAFACESCQQMQDCLQICRNHSYNCKLAEKNATAQTHY